MWHQRGDKPAHLVTPHMLPLMISEATWASSQSSQALSAIMAESFSPGCHFALFQGWLWRAEASERLHARVLSPSPVETH